MATTQQIRVEPTPRRLRATARGRTVFDTTRPLFVWERPFYPTFYVPVEDVDGDLLTETDGVEHVDGLGARSTFDLSLGDDVREAAAYTYHEPDVEALAGHMAFRWKALDHWFEEDEEVFVHARDPYTRVDILRSSRPVRVELDGSELASTTNASFLFETGHAVRHYLPKTDVRFELLTESETRTACPYKGVARYWNVTVDGQVHPDLVWGYDHPLPESQKVTGLVCFYGEKVDTYVDGELQERPRRRS